MSPGVWTLVVLIGYTTLMVIVLLLLRGVDQRAKDGKVEDEQAAIMERLAEELADEIIDDEIIKIEKWLEIRAVWEDLIRDEFGGPHEGGDGPGSGGRR